MTKIAKLFFARLSEGWPVALLYDDRVDIDQVGSDAKLLGVLWLAQNVRRHRLLLLLLSLLVTLGWAFVFLLIR